MKSTGCRTTSLFGLSALLGALIWILSPSLTGHREPWDANAPFYPLALVIAGFVPACFCARWIWLWAAGAWLGQVIAFLFLVALPGDGGLWPLGLFFLSVCSLLSLAGAGFGVGACVLLRRLFPHPTNIT